VNRKISFVLPVTLQEAGLSWRAPANRDTLLRTKLLLRTFLTQFRQDDLADFFLVSPDRDAPLLRAALRSVTGDPRYKLLSELEVCPNLRKATGSETGEVRGWRVQQMLKLAISAYVSSEHYVTLDNDIVCIRRCSYDDLVKNGRAVTNCETPVDYMRIYTSAFAAREAGIKLRRYARSQKILGHSLQRPNAQFYGETPVVLRTDMVSRLLEFLSGRFRGEWSEMLASKGGWTEYGLYYNFLEMTGKLDAFSFYAGCNCVLDLERSVWQASEHYRQPRLYDADHFAQGVLSQGCGVFAAVQSWLPVSSWLPARYGTLDAFYQDLERWLGIGTCETQLGKSPEFC